MRAEEQQEAMKRENEMLRQQIKMTVQQNMQARNLAGVRGREGR